MGTHHGNRHGSSSSRKPSPPPPTLPPPQARVVVVRGERDLPDKGEEKEEEGEVMTGMMEKEEETRGMVLYAYSSSTRSACGCYFSSG